MCNLAVIHQRGGNKEKAGEKERGAGLRHGNEWLIPAYVPNQWGKCERVEQDDGCKEWDSEGEIDRG